MRYPAKRDRDGQTGKDTKRDRDGVIDMGVRDRRRDRDGLRNRDT